MTAAPKPSRKDRPCLICGKPVGNRHNKKYCSLACHGASMRKNKQTAVRWPKARLAPKTCVRCGEKFQVAPSNIGRKWCSKPCYNADHPPVYLEAKCAECGILFRRRPANMRQAAIKFCSPQCSRAYFRAERAPAWRGGSNPNRGSGWLKRAEEARERDGRVCRRCGKTETENKERLSVDHLIPWREFKDADEANQLDNLVSLCRPCHAIKTQVAERLWLKGDVLAMKRHIEAVMRPSAAKARGFLA